MVHLKYKTTLFLGQISIVRLIALPGHGFRVTADIIHEFATLCLAACHLRVADTRALPELGPMLGSLIMIVRHRTCYTDCINGIEIIHTRNNCTN